jgi:3-oxoacyl-(acyl-carrier-protein) synthase
MTGPRRAVITGMEAISPAGVGLAALWGAASEGRSSGELVTAFDTSRHASRIAAPIPGFDPLALGLSRSQLARMDRVTQLAVVAARRAFARAGLSPWPSRAERMGACLGTAIGGVGFMERVFAACCQKVAAKPEQVTFHREIDPHTYRAFLALSPSSEVAADLGLGGPCTSMATGCTAGLDAIGAAAELIEHGAADVMVTGGADAPITPIVFTAFDNIKAITRRNDQPSRASRPFDRGRDGFLLAEGCAVLVLEEESHARRRGAEIHARVLGFASLSNAFHMTGLPEDGEVLARTLSRALERARLRPDQVDYINAHGSSTPQNDRNETAAFKRAFGPHAYRVPISSTKSVIGHALGAASALETAVCALALVNGVIPPTANLEVPSPDCDLDYVPNTARRAPLRVVECNASGFSGIHSSLLLSHRDFEVRA